MPAIRDEEWFYSPSFKEGAAALEENQKDVRFCGLMLGQDSLGDDEIDTILEAVRTSQTKSLCLDWFDVQTESFCKIGAMATDEFQYQLDSFHLTMIDLSVPARLEAVSSLVSNNKHIVDLILTFCRINCQNVHLLADALKTNEQILSLNINFNLLRKDGYLVLAEALKENKTLRYLEAKLNKAEKSDLLDFTRILIAPDYNTTLEYLDLGQEDDIDGNIEQNKIPEDTIPIPRKSSKKAENLKNAGSPPNGEDAPAPVPNNNDNNNANAENTDLFSMVKTYLQNNKSNRIEGEKQLKIQQLGQILESETPTIRASLKHSKIMMLGEKNSGKTFFAHCLVHQLYHAKDDGVAPAIRKIDNLCLARVTELGWTKITAFHHVDMIIAKRISTLPVNIENRNKANEVCFQFPEQVIISEKDLKTDSLLAKEDKELLKRLEIEDDLDSSKPVAPVFKQEETVSITNRFSERMNDIIDKALRENNYPSFSIWDADSPAGYNEIFPRFYNNHGMIFVFVSLVTVKNNPEQAIKSILKYLEPIDFAKADGKHFTSKVFIIGTFLDQVINEGIDNALSEGVNKFAGYKEEKGLSSSSGDSGHIDFLLQNLPEDDTDSRKLLEAVRDFLQGFNVDLTEAVAKRYHGEVVPNDGDDLLFFPLSNNLPTICKQYRCDFDDISGINKFRAKVRSLLDNQEIKVINVMKSLRDAKIIDALVARKTAPRVNDDDHRPDFISLKEFEELAATAGINSRAEIVILLRYLDVTGIVSWLSDNQILQSIIILRPDYIIKGLEKFYEIMISSEESVRALEGLRNEVGHQGLAKDFENLTNHRVVSHDLLLEKFLTRDNYEYFKDFLLNSYHLNRINLAVLRKLFVSQNLCNSTDSDELYLVPEFSKDEDDSAIKSAFHPYKARFISDKAGKTGCFERVLTNLIDALDNEVMEAQLLETKNSLECSKHFATFNFGDNSFSIAQLQGKDNLSYFQYEFNNEVAVTFLDFIERVVRNTLLIKEAYVSVDSEWIDMNEARKNNVGPYFVKKDTSNFDSDLLDMEDAFDEL